MKKYFNKITFMLLAAATLGFVGCNDKYEYDGPGAADAAAGFQKAGFVSPSLTVEKDPTEPTVTQIRVKRAVKGEAVDVPFKVITNTDDVFELGVCHFAEEDSIATFEVNYPNAEIGKQYTLQLTIDDKKFADSYTADNIFTLKLTRVKWNTLEGKARIVSALFPAGEGECDIQQREDNPNYYRMHHPYRNMKVLAGDGNYYYAYQFTFWSDEASEWLNFRTINVGETVVGQDVSTPGLVVYDDCNTGYHNSDYDADIQLVHPSGFASLADPANWEHNKVVSYQEDGSIGKIQLAPMFYMDGIGAFDYSQDDGIIFIYMPGYKDPVTADITKDFDWEEVYTGDFTSKQLGTTGAATLYKGTCTLTTDQADSVFAATYGTAYAIASPYAEDYNLYFTVDADGKIQVPEISEEYVGQPLGIQALGEDVYATINPKQSSFSENEIVLNMTFTNEDGSVVYGTNNEVLSHITYTTVGTADYTYTILFTNEDGSPYLDAGLELQKRDDKENVYRLLNWGLGSEFYFYWDQTTNRIDVPEQVAYGPYFIADIPTATGNPDYYDRFPSAYDPETGIANLFVYYYNAQGQGAYDLETMAIHLNSSEVAKKASKKGIGVLKLVGNNDFKPVFAPWANAQKVQPKGTKQLSPLTR